MKKKGILVWPFSMLYTSSAHGTPTSRDETQAPPVDRRPSSMPRAAIEPTRKTHANSSTATKGAATQDMHSSSAPTKGGPQQTRKTPQEEGGGEKRKTAGTKGGSGGELSGEPGGEHSIIVDLVEDTRDVGDRRGAGAARPLAAPFKAGTHV